MHIQYAGSQANAQSLNFSRRRDRDSVADDQSLSVAQRLRHAVDDARGTMCCGMSIASKVKVNFVQFTNAVTLIATVLVLHTLESANFWPKSTSYSLLLYIRTALAEFSFFLVTLSAPILWKMKKLVLLVQFFFITRAVGVLAHIGLLLAYVMIESDAIKTNYEPEYCNEENRHVENYAEASAKQRDWVHSGVSAEKCLQTRTGPIIAWLMVIGILYFRQSQFFY